MKPEMREHIEIHKTNAGFEVRVVSDDEQVLRRFTYDTIEGARRAATAWTAAYTDCPIKDLVK